MDVVMLRRILMAMGCAAFAVGPAQAQAPAVLPGYNAAIGETSISGVSSGAFMAVQFGTAWFSVIRGVGVVAGGPYWCARASSYFGYWDALARATGPCRSGPMPDLARFIAKADAKSAAGDIDSLQSLRRHKIYLFHGYNDKVVARPVTDAAADFYRHYLGEANRGNLHYQATIGAGHSLVVAQEPPSAELNGCTDNVRPFIDQCGYDQAGIILQHIYGALNRPRDGPLTGTIRPFDQSLYTSPRSPGSLSLGKTGYAFVPRECGNGEACRVHITLHGCNQQADDETRRRFIERAGYNGWADGNRLIVLYPQTTAKWYPYNPQACWDLWGYVDYDDSYVTKSGSQIRAIKAMLDALTARAKPPAAAEVASQAVAPAMLRVIDRSDTAADLAWVPQAGIAVYRVLRAGAEGSFAAVADVAGPGFADTGLAPRTAYRWRIAAIVNGAEGRLPSRPPPSHGPRPQLAPIPAPVRSASSRAAPARLIRRSASPSARPPAATRGGIRRAFHGSRR